MVVVAASKNVQEINIRAALRRSLGGPQTDAPTTKARALAEQKVVTRDRKCAAIATHPTKGCYVTGTYDGGRLDMWQYGTPSDAAPLSTATVANVDQRVTKLHFNVTGSKLGATDSGGHLSLFSLEQQALRPLMSLQVSAGGRAAHPQFACSCTAPNCTWSLFFKPLALLHAQLRSP